ncbi:MAG: aldo/keto reductase [Victivallaceae bacterium]|nr:aldo/keto reductase [Victivallaceae bacterium]
MLKKRILGRTGLEVSELSLGGLFISSFGAERAAAIDVIKHAQKLGINYIDTAPRYRDSESVLGEALSQMDEDFIISTKIGYNPEPFNPKSAEFLRNALSRSMKNLQRDSVDILMIHEPDRWRDQNYMDWWDDTESYTGPVMDILTEAKNKGITKFIGLGGTTADEMPLIMDTGNFDVVLSAFNYDLLWRDAEKGILNSAQKHDMGIVCGSPLHQGVLAKVYQKDVIDNPIPQLDPRRREQLIELYELVNDIGISLPELSIRFLLSNPCVSTVLTGVRSIEELESNVEAATKGALPQAILDRLQSVFQILPNKPAEEPITMTMQN